MKTLTRLALTAAVLTLALVMAAGIVSLALTLPGWAYPVVCVLTWVNTWVVMDVLAAVWRAGRAAC